MRSLMESNRNPLSNARIVRALQSSDVEKAEEEIQRVIVKGGTIDLRTNLWGTCATELKTASYRCWLG